ncbi:MAG TPA: hypothetical protein DD657_01930 [Culturomica sp.]|nr:hypothetical protein [Culturomica sp.]
MTEGQDCPGKEVKPMVKPDLLRFLMGFATSFAERSEIYISFFDFYRLGIKRRDCSKNYSLFVSE